jgi:PAS domain S-box-containing protein
MERFSNQYVARTVLPWLPVIYAGIGLVYLVAPENGINRETVILSWLTAIAMMSIWIGLWRLPDSRVGALLIGCALVGQSYALSFPFISDDPERFVAFLVTQMGIGCLFYSPLTTLGLGLVGTMGFLGVAATLTSPLGLHWYVDLAATVALSVVVAYFRTVAFESAQKADTEIRLEHTRQRDVFQMALDAVVTADQNGAILDWNAKAEEIFGWKREEVVGRLLADTIVPAQHREKHSHGMKRAKEGASPVVVGSRIEIEACHRSGRQFPIELSITVLRRADGPTYTAFLRDITDRRAFVAEQARGRELAEEADRLKGEFLATISHEIRTPLYGVLGMTEMALEAEDADERTDLLDRSFACASTLLTLLTDILDFSRVGRAEVDLEVISFNPRELLDGILDTFAVEAGNRGLELLGNVAPLVPDRVEGDPARIRQVLVNLVGNAVKFTERGWVQVDIDGEAEDTSFKMRIRVRDTGIGIDLESRAAMFDAFRQADASTTRRYGGTGLGLAISKGLVELMDGEIGYEPVASGGSEFWFRLAMRADAHPIAPEPLPEIGRVLVAYPAPATREFLENLLNSWGGTVATVADLAAADRELGTARQVGAPFRLVVADLTLAESGSPRLRQSLAEHIKESNSAVIGLVPLSKGREAFRDTPLIRQIVTSPIKSGVLRAAVESVLKMNNSTRKPASVHRIRRS